MPIKYLNRTVIAVYLGTAASLICGGDLHAETRAGTMIANTAQLRAAGDQTPVFSNQQVTVVAERLDVTLTAASPPIAADDRTIVAAVLTNRGNGQEAFAVTATTAPAATGALRLAIDADGDGRYDAARDPDLEGTTPVLAPGQAITLFALVPGATDTVTIRTAAVTGSGESGTTFAAAGDGGGDAVTGASGAAASITVPLTAAAPFAPTLAKSAEVRAPDGSAQAVPGATITYTLIARFPSATASPRVVDAIPAGTTYAAASLSLDGTPLSDLADADAGDAGPARISVALADQPAGAAHTVRFTVVIQ